MPYVVIPLDKLKQAVISLNKRLAVSKYFTPIEVKGKTKQQVLEEFIATIILIDKEGYTDIIPDDVIDFYNNIIVPAVEGTLPQEPEKSAVIRYSKREIAERKNFVINLIREKGPISVNDILKAVIEKYPYTNPSTFRTYLYDASSSKTDKYNVFPVKFKKDKKGRLYLD